MRKACFQVEVTAAKYVHRGVLMLGPGMDRQVALGNDDYSGNSVGAEGMKMATNDGGTHNLGGGAQDAFGGCGGSDLTDRALVQLQVNVSP